MKMRLITPLLVLILTGCATPDGMQRVTVPVSNVAHPVERSDAYQYLSCDYKSWFVQDGGNTFDADPRFKRERSGKGLASSMHALPSEMKQLAVESFIYALMSANAYRDPKDAHFSLPGWEVKRREEGGSGLAFEEYHRVNNGKVEEIVFAFKGTDGFLDGPDARANFSIWWEPKQYAQAQAAVKQRLQEPEYAGVPVVVTGHSLGGAIALNISLRQSTKQREIKAYVFNSSPRAFYRPIDGTVAARRVAIDEKGEFLKVGRFIWFGKFRNYWPTTYNFLNFGGAAKNFSEHSIYRMSRALMLVAIGANDPYAREVFRKNIVAPFGEGTSNFDWRLCEEVIGDGPLRWEPVISSL